MKIVLLTGASGAGTTTAKYVFEEHGFSVMENFPAKLTNEIVESIKQEATSDKYLFITGIDDAHEVYMRLKQEQDVELLFIILSAEVKTLITRFALTRHVHPRSVKEKISLKEALEKDASKISEIYELADYVFDTSCYSNKELKRHIFDVIVGDQHIKPLDVTFISYGIKNGIPDGIDISFDVRALPNPFWVDELKDLTGYDKPAIDFIESSPLTDDLFNHIVTYLKFQFKVAVNEGRGHYTVGISCSGGQHRSTYMAKRLSDYFMKDYSTSVIHRDTPSLNK